MLNTFRNIVGGAAAEIARRITPHQSLPRYARKAVPILWPDWRNNGPMWNLTDYATYIDEGMEANSLIYSAVMYKVRAASQARMRAYIGDPERPKPAPATNALERLLRRPNPHQSWREFQGLQTAYLNITGNAYTLLDRPTPGAAPRSLWPLNPTLVRILPGADNTLRGYRFSPSGLDVTSDIVPILPDDMSHVKLPSLSDPLGGLGYGQSPIAAMAMSGDIESHLNTFLRNFFANGAMLGGLLKFDVALDQNQMNEIREKWHNIYGGVDNWGNVGILDVNGKYERMIPTFAEMGLAEIDDRTETRILGPLGVPGMLIGAKYAMSRSTFTNVEEARRMFWEDTMLYELALFEVDWQHYLTPELFGGAFPMYDISDIPALRRDVIPLIDGAQKLWGMGVPARISFATVGLEVEQYEGDDISFLPMNVQSATRLAEREAQPIPDPALLLNPGSRPDDEDADAEETEDDDELAAARLRLLPSGKGADAGIVKKNGRSRIASG